MHEPRTHAAIDRELCGRPVVIEPGHAEVELTTTQAMAADACGLVHGGFVFGAADYAAMLAVNDPNVVLGAATVKLTAPVRVGEVVRCVARVASANGKKREVEVVASVGATRVLLGTFTCAVLERHVLELSPR